MTTNQHPKLRFLAIDDDARSAELLARIAGRCGYEAKAIVETSGLADLVVNWRPDVISLDLDMPTLDGGAVITLLSVMAFPGHLLIVSGMATPLREAACEAAQASGLRIVEQLRKPVDVKAVEYILGAVSFAQAPEAAADALAAAARS